ncbi:MAG: response regulator [Candidatus Thiodiazotropha lotti]|nr:response regulator [Candidatus Thiodiazotropha lotti]MCG7932362.1 response regulator [Candidatus Thiodiazotropha lotti]MCG8001940.1 response regulator [Candidatus Thiodiazotropha lotti]MCG8009624.1 response regulator [Candidatus Thiodiazotropha lotti]MCW4185558.1 response regulator [Candidatus Thiodiazotropha lotti]
MSKQAFLVDDSKSARIVLSRMLKKSGFDGVEMAESGEEALERLKTLTPDAIFVDFLMEGIDGLETITEIKKDPRFDATPIVMCTANEGDEYVRAAVDHGALGILAKPPTEESLGEIIDLIEEHQREVAMSASAQVEVAEEQAELPVDLVEAGETPAQAVPVGLSEAEIKRIAQQAATQSAEVVVREIVEQAVTDSLEQRLAGLVDDYLEQKLQPMLAELKQQQSESAKPAEIDTEELKKAVVEEVNSDLEDFVRQLSQRSVEELIQATTFTQINETRDEFSDRLKQQEARILEQVPEKNDMIEHIRVVTEGSLEAHVHETATQVSQEVANSVATETVEQMLEQHLAQQTVVNEKPAAGNTIWVMLGALLAASAGAAYYLL